MESTWYGYLLEKIDFENREALIVHPAEGTGNGRLAIKTEYWDAFPQTEMALLEKGFHLCFIRNDTRWGTDPDLDRKARFVRFIAKRYSLDEKTVPIGMSCGGLIAIKFAAKYPELVSCLYLDAPVLNYLSCPCGFGTSEPLDNGKGTAELLKALELDSISQLISYREMPLDRLSKLVEQRIPVIMSAGGSDNTVPYQENGLLLQQTYEKAGMEIEVHIDPKRGHHPHGLENPETVVNYILSH